MSKRKEGWYWVKQFEGWECAEFCRDGWYLNDRLNNPYNDDVLKEIGPRIPTPEEQQITVVFKASEAPYAAKSDGWVDPEDLEENK